MICFGLAYIVLVAYIDPPIRTPGNNEDTTTTSRLIHIVSDIMLNKRGRS